MLKKFEIFVAVLIFMSMFHLSAQDFRFVNSQLPFEEITLFTDRDIYLSGEKIWFSARCIIHGYEEQHLSTILFVELYNASGKSIVQNKFRLSKGKADGVIVIPPEFLSGNYFLRAYTNYLRNFDPETYFTKVVTVINPSLPLPKTSGKAQNKAELNYNKAERMPDAIEISTNKKQYKKREIVELNIRKTAKDSWMDLELVVSVVKKGTLYDYSKYPSDNFERSNNIKSRNLSIEYPDTLPWLPDIRDVSLSGIVIDEVTNEPLSDVSVYLFTGKKNPQVHISRTDENGKYIFSLNNFEGDQEVFLSPLRWREGAEPKIKVYSDFMPVLPELSEMPLVIDTSDYTVLEEMLVNIQASKSFSTEQGRDTLPMSHFPFSFDNPPITVLLDDYIKTPDLETVFRELVPRVRLRKKGEVYSLSVFDFDNTVYYDDPLVLIDNIPVSDVNELLKIPADYIEKIEVYNTPVILGDNILKGIIILTTNTDDFGGMSMPHAASFLKYKTLTPVLGFDPPDYSEKEAKEDARGDFRTTLHWIPDIKFRSDTTISFYTSDHVSEYEVVVGGINAKGEKVIGRTIFGVVR